MISCSSSSSHEEKYIELLEDKIEELSKSNSSKEGIVFSDIQVISKVKDYISFNCSNELSFGNISLFRKGKNAWLVSVTIQSEEFDEFGFPIERKVTLEVVAQDGYLVPQDVLNSQLCD
jgi:hypothetical protein